MHGPCHSRALALAISLILLTPLRGYAANVLVVSDPSAVDPNIGTALRADGHVVTERTGDFAAGNPALLGDLSPYGLVVWIASGGDYGDQHSNPAVFTALETFVTNGGRVLVTGYDSIASPTDPLLIAFLGGAASRDVPAPPGPIARVANSLTTGVVDIRGQTPLGFSADRDALTGVLPGTVIVCPTSTEPLQGQWTLRALGAGEIAWVSNGNGSARPEPNWLVTAAGPTGAYNAALRNFAHATGPAAVVVPTPTPTPTPNPTPLPGPPAVVPPPDDPLPPIQVAPPRASAPLEFNANDRAGFGWSVGVQAHGSHTIEDQRWFVGGTVEAGLTLALDMEGADGGRHPALNGLVGDAYALVARGHFLGRVDRGSDAAWAVAVGGQVTAVNALNGSDVRVPSLLGLLSPELGAMFRDDRDARLYVAWHAPFSFLLESWLSLDLRASMFFLEGWRSAEGRETLFLVSGGLSIR